MPLKTLLTGVPECVFETLEMRLETSLEGLSEDLAEIPVKMPLVTSMRGLSKAVHETPSKASGTLGGPKSKNLKRTITCAIWKKKIWSIVGDSF